MDINRVIKERRSHREFEDRDIPDKDINEIVLSATLAPSAKNRQPWYFYRLKNRYKNRFIKILKSKFKDLTRENKPTGSLSVSINSIESCSDLIVVYNVFSRHENDYNNRRWSADTQSIGASIQNMILEAHNRDIKSLWICDIFYAANEINRFLESDNELVAAVALGYGSRTDIPARPRFKLSNKLKELY